MKTISLFGVLLFSILAGEGASGADESLLWKGGAPEGPSAWEQPANWTEGTVPRPADSREIVIPAGMEHDPVVEKTLRVTGALRIRNGATLTVRAARLEVDGGLILERGAETHILDGAEIWSDIERNGTNILDVGLRLGESVRADDLLPGLRVSGGALPDVWRYESGPEPTGRRVNIAPFAERTVFPYMTMTHTLVDPDPDFRTMSRPERGTPASATRYTFRFDKPHRIVGMRWNSPYPRWAVRADTTGRGEFDRLLALDLEGRVFNTGGVWVARTTMALNFERPVKTWGVQIVDLGGNSQMYDVQILAKKPWWPFQPPHPYEIMRGEHLEGGVPFAATGAVFEVAIPEPSDRLPRGFHIEPWMFALDQWIDKSQEERPPLVEYPPFVKFVENLRKYHADTVNMWPPKKFNDKRGEGTYESPLLWPSAYDRHSLEENVLEQVADAFQAEGIRFMSMTRTAYPKPLEEFPEAETAEAETPYISRHRREYLKGIVREQVRSGVDGVGIGFDEQQSRALGNPRGANESTRAAFKERYDLDVPDRPEDSLAFRKWIVFAYKQFADYLGDAAREAKAIHPDVLTKNPTHVTLGTLWNDRVGVGIAEDIVARAGKIDYSRAYAYFSFSELNHYKTALATKISAGGRADRKTVSLHNCPWAPNPETQSGFYLHFPPVHMLASPISAVMHGGGMPLYWRYNWIFRGGYDKQVRKAFRILDVLSAWGLGDSRVPKTIAVLRSRASEDWWQIRQRFGKTEDPREATRGHLAHRAILEALLVQGLPFDVLYLDYPDELDHRLAEYDLAILPFPYSIRREAFAAVQKAVESGMGLMVFEKRGETDEWGEAYEKPLFEAIPASKQVVYPEDKLPEVAQRRTFRSRFHETVDRLLGENKPLYLNTYGNDVEAVLREKNDREKFLALINWTERPVTVDAGLRVPQGMYRVRQAGTDGARDVILAGRQIVDAHTLSKFRVEIAPWDVRVLNVYPSEN